MTRLWLALALCISASAQYFPNGSGSGNSTYCADATGSTTTYTCPTPTPAVSSLTTGLIVTFVPQTTNTGTSTLNIANLGAKTLKQQDGVTNVASGALVGGSAYQFTYNGTNLVQMSGGVTTSTQLTDTANLVYTNQARTMAALLTIPGGDVFLGGVNAQSGVSYTFVASDDAKLTTFNNAGAVAVTLPQAGTAGFGAGAFFYTFNRGAGAVTITPTTSTINGAATLLLNQNQGALIVSDGSNYSAWASSSPVAASAATTVNTTFGATPTFTCPSSTQGTVVYFTLSTTLTANITGGTLASCTAGETLVFKFVQDATGGRTVTITGTDAFLVHPAANQQTVCVFTADSATTARLAGCTAGAGYSAGSTVAAPGTPPASDFYTWVDSTSGKLCDMANNSATQFCTLQSISGTAAMGTSAIASGACATVVTVSATGTATTDVVEASFNGDPTAVTGYVPSANGMLTIIVYPTANNVNFKVCNNTSSSITPGAITLNWRVTK